MIKHLPLLIISLLSIFSESLVFFGIFWSLISLGASKIYIGVCIGSFALIPYVFQFTFKKLSDSISKNIKSMFCYLSFFGAILAISLFNTNFSVNIIFLYALMSIFSAIFYLTNQIMEITFSLKVIHKELSEVNASRILQISLTAGSCLGGLFTGISIDHFGLKGVSALSCLSYIIIISISAIYLKNSDNAEINIPQNNFQIQKTEKKYIKKINLLYPYSILCLLFFATSGFNFLLPIFVQSKMIWNATIFGLADGAAALGAFLAILFINFLKLNKYLYLSFILSFSLCGYSINFFSNSIALILCSFVWGLSMNTIRMHQRTIFFEHNKSHREAVNWSSRLVIGRMLIEAFCPIFLGITLTYFLPSYLFYMLGILISIFILIFISINKMNIIKNKLHLVFKEKLK